MSIQKQHSLYAVYDGDNTTLHTGIRDQEVDPGIDLLLLGADGIVWNQYVAVQTQNPRVRFSTVDCSILSTCGLEGASISSGLDMYFRQRNKYGTYKTGSDHVKATVNQGMWVPQGISADQGSEAVCSFEVIPVASGDGTSQVDPVTVATGQAIPGAQQNVSKAFTLGPVVLNGSQVHGVQGIDVDFGLQVNAEGSEGQVYPTFCSLVLGQPRVTIRFTDAELLATYMEGVSRSDTTTVYLRPYAEGGTRGASNAISFAVNEGMIHAEAVSASHGGNAQPALVITPTYDNTNLPLVIATNASIPANM